MTEQQSKWTEIKNPLDKDAYIVPYPKTLENRAKNNCVGYSSQEVFPHRK